MRALFLGRKPAASIALSHLVDSGVEVAAVVAPQPPGERPRDTFWRPLLRNTARELGIPVLSAGEIEALASRDEEGLRGRFPDIDVVISFLYWRKIPRALIDLPRIGCFNFHPAPLPGFRGRRGYNFAILEGAGEYGASLHWVSEGFDEGNLVDVRTFPVARGETALSLEAKTMRVLVQMFDDFIEAVSSGNEIPSVPQGKGATATRKELLDAMRIMPGDDRETIRRKVRAFWYPPHTGATIELAGDTYTLIDAETLSRLGRFIHGSRKTPW